MTITLNNRRLFFLLHLLLFAFSFKRISATSLLSDHADTLFTLQQHKFNGALFKHDGLPVSFDHFDHVRRRDGHRCSRVLAETSNTVNPVSFRLGGIADPNIAGLYFTEIFLGSPPSKHYVQVDTGSDVLWVNCANCKTCPKSSDLGVPVTLFDPRSSLTSSSVMCDDGYCNKSYIECLAKNICGYHLGYGDGSSSDGIFIRDSLHFNMLQGNNSVNGSANVIFGCGTRRGGELRDSEQALDGILGFGQSNLSIISQLRSKNKAPAIFAHCLESEGNGGGILIIGKVQAPGLVYTPMLQHQPHYNVNLTHITINDITIHIDSSPSQNGGTIVDSGTTLTFFSKATYKPLLQAIFDAVKVEILKFQWEGLTCVLQQGSADHIFPTIGLQFEGGLDMIIRPHEYLIPIEGGRWCIGFQSTGLPSLNLNMLGALVLKDRLVVYDLDQQRIGLVKYDCGSNVTVLSSTGQKTSVLTSSIPMGHASSGIDQRDSQKLLWLACLISYYLLLSKL